VPTFYPLFSHGAGVDLSDCVSLLPLQPISVVFQVTVNGVGLLDPGAETNCVSVCPTAFL
jgi:hypothetical protein